ncbi:MAG: acyl carrier protein [Frankiales bacterium]|nr:acyl carrier protein [Frankiales bacterium]
MSATRTQDDQERGISPVDDTIRKVLADHGRLAVDAAGLDRHADLYEAGLTSHASVNIMLALEDAFDLEFPDRLLKKSTFSSIASIEDAITELSEGGS